MSSFIPSRCLRLAATALLALALGAPACDQDATNRSAADEPPAPAETAAPVAPTAPRRAAAAPVEPAAEAAAAAEPAAALPPHVAVADAPSALAAADAAAQLLPGSTLLFVATADLRTTLEALGRERLASTWPDIHGALATALREATGHDLLDPANLAAVGVDASGPAGVAWLEPERALGVAFVALQDPALALRTLEAVAERSALALERSTSTDGSAVLLLNAAEGGAVIVRNGLLLWVFGERAEADALVRAAGALLEAAPAASLAASPSWQEARGELSRGRLLAGYGALAPALGAMRGEPEWAVREREAAGRREASPEELAALEADIARARGHREARASTLEALLGAEATLAFGLEASGADVLAELDLALGERALLRGLLREPGPMAPALASADESVRLVLAARLEPGRLGELAALFGGHDEALPAALGLDLLGDALSVGTGEIALVLGGELPERVEREGALRGFELVASVGVSDAAAAAALLERVAAAPSMAEHLARAEDGGWTLTTAALGALHVQLGGDPARLVVASTRRGLERTLAGQRGALAASDTTLAARLRGDDAAATLALDPTLLALRWLEPPPSPPRPQPPASDVAGYAERLAELRELDGRIDAAIEHEAQSARRFLERAVEPLGVAALDVRPSARGLSLEGGLYTRSSSLAALVARLVEGAVELSTTARQDEGLGELLGRRYELMRELEQLASPAPEAPAPADEGDEGATATE